MLMLPVLFPWQRLQSKQLALALALPMSRVVLSAQRPLPPFPGQGGKARSKNVSTSLRLCGPTA